MTKHTPGPWRVEGRYVMALKEKQVCEAPTYGVVHGKVDAANVRLIAAAPELLEFAKEVRRTGDTRLASMAIAVIAKAIGGIKCR